MDAKVFEVTAISFAITEIDKRALLLHANGKVSSSGWRNGRLIPYVYINPPKDGVWDFDFVATVPASLALTVVSPIAAEQLISPAPDWCRGVRVHAGSNMMERVEPNLDTGGAKLFGVDTWPWKQGQTALLSAGNVAAGGDYFPWTVNS